MKKVLSALVLSAAVVASAGQAYAYDDFNIFNDKRGTLVQVLYTWDDNAATTEKEIIVNNGDFLTSNNTVLFDHQFSETNKVLSTVDYSTIFGADQAGKEVRVAYYLDDMVTAAYSPRNWDAYYVTTDLAHGGEVPTPTSGKTSNSAFKKFNTLSSTFLVFVENRSIANGGADIVTATYEEAGFYNNEMSNEAEYYTTDGSYAGINTVSASFGEAVLSDYANCVDLYLWGVRHDTMATTVLTDDLNSSLGLVATLRFNKTTGETILNPTDTCPVPVPAAAWLLGSGLLGMFGLRRRNA
jgi:hypothetical protein